MRSEHIFGDIERKAGQESVPASAFAHPKAGGLFGQRRGGAPEHFGAFEVTTDPPGAPSAWVRF